MSFDLHRIVIRVASVVSCATILSCCLNSLNANAANYMADRSIYDSTYANKSCGVDNTTGKWVCECGAKGNNNVRGWNQGFSGYGSADTTDPISKTWGGFKLGTSDESCMNKVGCFATAFGICLKMSGAYGDDYCILGAMRYFKDEGGFGSGGGYSGSFGTIAAQLKTPSGDTAVDGNGALACVSSSNVGGRDKLYDECLKQAKDGYYVIIRDTTTTTSHFMPVISVDTVNGEERLCIAQVGDGLGDVEANYPKGEFVPKNQSETAPDGWYKQPVYVDEMYVFAMPDHKFTGQVNSSGSTSSGGANAPTMTGFYNYMEETYFIDRHTLNEQAIELLSRADLWESEGGLDKVKEIEQWKSNIDNKKEDNIARYIRAGFMFFGILITLYSIFLYIAYQVDRINNFIDISLLATLTFGRLNVAPEDTNGNFNTPDSGRAKYLKHKDIIIVCILGVGIGVLFISGKIFALMGTLKTFLDKLFS